MSHASHEILPGLYRFESKLAGPHQPVNSYVWRAGRKTIIIDPAGDLTPAALSEAGAGRIPDILVTHVQQENIAGCANFPDARIHVPAGDAYLCNGPEAYAKVIENWQPPWEWETRGNFTGNLAGAANERPCNTPLRLSTPLSAGEPCSGCTLIATPGHGKNALAIIAEIAGKRVAFCGDLVCGDGQLWNWFDSEWDYGLQGGPQALLKSAAALLREKPDILCPTHGPVLHDPQAALTRLQRRLEAVLAPGPSHDAAAVNFPDTDSPAPGFRQILPHLHQYRAGNLNVLLSATGNALVVDDGLCFWEPLPQRTEHHRQVITDMKRALDVRRIELAIPSHYHGDHTENIPELTAIEGTQVACVDDIADTIECPERFGVTCLLPWYGSAYERFRVDRRLLNGQRMRWHEYVLEVFMLGGQTWYTHGISVRIDRVRTQFVGDSIGGFGTGCEPPLCYNDCEPSTRGWAFAVDKMIEHKPDLLVCGHGIAIRDPMPMLAKKQAAWRQRMMEFDELNFRGNRRLFFDPFLRNAE